MDIALDKIDPAELLDKLYNYALNGVATSKDCYTLADEYLTKYNDRDKAIEKFVNRQVEKCSVSGFATSFGGFVAMPINIPANVSTVVYMQMRMIATIAIMCDLDPADDEVQTLAYVCLTGTSLTKLCKEAGIKFADKMAINAIKKIPGKVLTKINQKLGFRFITKFGEKGLINLGKMVPIAGGLVGGGMDLVETKAIAHRTINVFRYDIID